MEWHIGTNAGAGDGLFPQEGTAFHAVYRFLSIFLPLSYDDAGYPISPPWPQPLRDSTSPNRPLIDMLAIY